jgi:hypothetical protein
MEKHGRATHKVRLRRAARRDHARSTMSGELTVVMSANPEPETK